MLIEKEIINQGKNHPPHHYHIDGFDIEFPYKAQGC